MSFAVDYRPEPRPGEQTIRGAFVPPWYRPHADLGVSVKSQAGKMLGFVIGEVVVERRWAIQDDGRCMDQREFEVKLHDWRRGQFQWQMPPKPVPDLSFESIPSVEGFVSRGEDPANHKRLIDLTRPVKRTGLLRPVEPIVDETISRDPRWKVAPAKPPADEPVEAAAPAPAPAPVPAPKPKKTVAKIPCPDCGHMVGGENGLRLHRKHKHKEG